MKPLPLHSLPSDRMASLTNGRRLQILEARRERHEKPWWSQQDDSQSGGAGCGTLAVVSVVLIGIISSFIISFI
jgi:hypothetical protein